MQRFFQKITELFPIWVLLASLTSFVYPPLFTWFKGSLITIGLSLIMLGMALTLEISDFKRIVKYPKWVLTGLFLQFSVMPLMGYFLGKIFHLPNFLAAGLILVSCCPGGTASNVISFLARAHVALSVTMTAFSTLTAVLLTPFLTTILIGSRVEVDAWGLLISTFKVVLVPLVAGFILKKYLPRLTNKLVIFSPFVAVVMIVMIVASIIGASRATILSSGFNLILAVISLHLAGFSLGYVLAWLVNKDKQVARTVAIEVGMQNSGLGVYLARRNFTDPLVAVPAAISGLVHCLIGSVVASLWSRSKGKDSVVIDGSC